MKKAIKKASDLQRRSTAKIKEGIGAVRAAAEDLPDAASDLGRHSVTIVRDGVDTVRSVTKNLAERIPTNAPAEVVILEDMPEELKACYLSVLVWLVFADDRTVDERELCELQILSTQLQCSAETRHKIRLRQDAPEELDVNALLNRMLALQGTDSSEAQLAIKCSLMKDAIRIHRATSDGLAHSSAAVAQLADMLNLDEKKISMLENTCIEDEKTLNGELSDAVIVRTIRELSAQATAVGVPLTAIYMSGSVVGLSAAGVTSGLAALGLGGVLALSSMVTGIGVAIVAGAATYKGVQWLLGGRQRSKASRRELMLQEVLMIHQKAVVNLAEDMTYFERRIENLKAQSDKTEHLIEMLTREMKKLARYAGAMTRLQESTRELERDFDEEVGKRKDA